MRAVALLLMLVGILVLFGPALGVQLPIPSGLDATDLRIAGGCLLALGVGIFLFMRGE